MSSEMSIGVESGECIAPARPSVRDEFREMMVMSLPVVVSMSTRMVMDVTDFFMISKVSTAAQAAILPAQVTVWCYIAFGVGIVSMVNTFVSQSLGRKRYSECSMYAWQGMYVSIVLGLIAPLLIPVFKWAVPQFGHEPAVVEQELRYMCIVIFSVGMTLGGMTFSNFFNGIHKTWVSMCAQIEGVLINAVVGCILIFGYFGAPKMGIEGAAWGTVVGTTYIMIRLGLTMSFGKYGKQYDSLKTWKLRPSKLMNVIKTGLPQGFQMVSDVVVWMVFISILIGKYFQTEDLQATNIAWQYMRIAFMPCLGVGVALSAVVGKAVGEKDFDKAMRMTRLALFVTLAYMFFAAAVFIIARYPLIGFFNNSHDALVLEIGVKVLICAAIFQASDAMVVVYNSALRGAGDTLWPSVIFVITHWVVVVGGGFFMVWFFHDLGSVGPWIAATALIILLGWVLFFRWHGRKWMSMTIFKDETGSEEVHPNAEERAVNQKPVFAPEIEP